MTTTTNFHNVASIRMKQTELKTGAWFVTELIAINKDGEIYILTLVHEGPLSIEGSDFINFVNSAEEA